MKAASCRSSCATVAKAWRSAGCSRICSSKCKSRQPGQATQQNASLVEEAAAAAEALHEQAQQLSHSVSVFRLDATAQAALIPIGKHALKTAPRLHMASVATLPVRRTG